MLKVYAITLLLFICSRQVAAQATMSAEQYFAAFSQLDDPLVGFSTTIDVKVKENDTTKVMAGHYGFFYILLNNIQPINKRQFNSLMKKIILQNNPIFLSKKNAESLILVNKCDCEKYTVSSAQEFKRKYIGADGTVKWDNLNMRTCIVHAARQLRIVLFYAEGSLAISEICK